jgi:hypothetical protein
MATAPTLTEADILEEIVSPNEAGLPVDVARTFLDMKFGEETMKRIRKLLQKNNQGKISSRERATLENYLRVGKLVDLLQAKAKLSHRGNGDAR